MTIIRTFLAFIVLGVFLLVPSPQTGVADDGRITLGLTTRNGSTALPFTIADDKGFVKREGLNAVIVVMQNQVVVNGVVSRNVDYGGTFSNFVGAALAGLPVRIVMSAMDGSDHFLVTSPAVKRVEDLKGKIFGISSFGGTPHSEAIMILRKYGMNPEKDVTFLQIGGSASRYTALEGGAIQAAMLVPPFNNFARKRGFNQLLGFNDIMNIPLGGLTVHTQRIKEKPDEIVKMIKAVLRATDYIRTHKPETVSYMEAKWGIKDAEVRDSIYGDISVLYSRTGIAPDETMKNVVQLVRDTRKSKDDVPMSDIVDWSFAKRAQAELKMK